MQSEIQSRFAFSRGANNLSLIRSKPIYLIMLLTRLVKILCLNEGNYSVLTKIYLLLALWTLWHGNSIRKDTSRGRPEIDGTA